LRAEADKDAGTGTLRIENTDPNMATVINVNSSEEIAGRTSPTDGTISSTDDLPLTVTPRVRKLRKKPRKQVQVYSEPFIIPPGHVWLAGDNTANSTDSRYQLTQSP
jgi:Signal peptidase, peptidase S26